MDLEVGSTSRGPAGAASAGDVYLWMVFFCFLFDFFRDVLIGIEPAKFGSGNRSILCRWFCRCLLPKFSGLWWEAGRNVKDCSSLDFIGLELQHC